MLAVIPPLADADRYVASQCTAATSMDVNFMVFASGQLLVLLDGEELDSDLFTFESVSGKSFNDGPIDDGRLRFDPAVTGFVEIFGDRAPRRETQWVEGQGVPTRTQNLAYTRLEATLREVRALGKRAIKLPPGEVQHYVPAIADRAGKYLFFEAVTGKPVAANVDPSIVQDATDALDALVAAANAALDLKIDQTETLIENAEAGFDAEVAGLRADFADDLADSLAAKTGAESARDTALGYRNDAQTDATTATTQAGIATTKAGETAAAVALVEALAVSVGSSILDLGDWDGLSGEATIDFGDWQ